MNTVQVIFSLVLYKQSLYDIQPLLDSIKQFCNLNNSRYTCELVICDNSPQPSPKIINWISNNLSTSVSFNDAPQNMGFGLGHNLNFSSANIFDDGIFIIVNPDIYFEPDQLLLILDWYSQQKNEVSCCAPLIVNSVGHIQFSAKKNPTFLSLLLGRFRILRSLKFLDRYDAWHKNMDKNYTTDFFESTYLSGCFLLTNFRVYKQVEGFSKRYFLHMEDADFVRKCSFYGKTLHSPIGVVTHRWARGSHRSIRQMLFLIASAIKYFRYWGFKFM